jgi:hypothetical protein
MFPAAFARAISGKLKVTSSDCEVNRLIHRLCGERLQSIDFARGADVFVDGIRSSAQFLALPRLVSSGHQVPEAWWDSGALVLV